MQPSNYIFKPPPPPPPPAAAQQNQFNGHNRGRGRGGQGHNGRGGGGRGGHRGGMNNEGNRPFSDRNANQNSGGRPQPPQNYQNASGAQQSRFQNPPAQHPKPKPKPQGHSYPAPPAFGAPLTFFPSLSQINNDLSGANSNGAGDEPASKRRRVDDEEPEEDDEDEEARLAALAVVPGGIVPIPGTSIVLASPEDIKMWIAERKKNWPTEARIEEKKKMRAGARGSRYGHGAKDSNAPAAIPPASDETNDPGQIDSAASDRLTREDGAESDSDGAPEEESAKVQKTVRTAAPERPKPRERQLCNAFVQSGRCKFGYRCRFSHDKQAVKAARQKEEDKRSFKPLYVRLLEQQKDEEDRIAVQAIKFLFDQGKLGSLDN